MGELARDRTDGRVGETYEVVRPQLELEAAHLEDARSIDAEALGRLSAVRLRLRIVAPLAA